MVLAVVFGGGGVRGAFQAGAWAELSRWLKPDFVIGSSIGAINAWATTRMSGEELVAWWLSRAPSRLLPYQTQTLDGLLAELLTLPKRQSWPALAVCTPLGQRVPHVVTLHAATGHAWLRASAALPGWYAPVKIGQRFYVDGGVVNDLPVAIAKDIGASQVIALSAAGLGPTPMVGATPVLTPPKDTLMLNFSLANRQALVAAGRKAARDFANTYQIAQRVEIHGKKVQNERQHYKDERG